MTTLPTTPQAKAPSVADYEKLGQQLKPFTIDEIQESTITIRIKSSRGRTDRNPQPKT